MRRFTWLETSATCASPSSPRSRWRSSWRAAPRTCRSSTGGRSCCSLQGQSHICSCLCNMLLLETSDKRMKRKCETNKNESILHFALSYQHQLPIYFQYNGVLQCWCSGWSPRSWWTSWTRTAARCATPSPPWSWTPASRGTSPTSPWSPTGSGPPPSWPRSQPSRWLGLRLVLAFPAAILNPQLHH